MADRVIERFKIAPHQEDCCNSPAGRAPMCQAMTARNLSSKTYASVSITYSVVVSNSKLNPDGMLENKSFGLLIYMKPLCNVAQMGQVCSPQDYEFKALKYTDCKDKKFNQEHSTCSVQRVPRPFPKPGVDWMWVK